MAVAPDAGGCRAAGRRVGFQISERSGIAAPLRKRQGKVLVDYRLHAARETLDSNCFALSTAS